MSVIFKKIIIIIIFLIVGFALLLLSWKNGIITDFKLTIVGILGVGFSLFLGTSMLISLLKDPSNFILNQEKEYQRNNKRTFFRFMNNNLERERKLFFFIFKTPLIWSLYLMTFIVIIAFFYFEFSLGNFFIPKFLKILHFTNNNILFIFSSIFCYSFVVLSILLIPFLILGEVYQKKFKTTTSNIFLQVIIDFIYAIPYLIIWSILWVLFILTAKKRESNIDTIKSLSIFAIISAFSYWTYYSLAKIAYDDKRTIFPAENPINFYKQKGKEILRIWVSSGFYFAIPFGIFILVFSINTVLNSFSIISKETIEIIFKYSSLYLGMTSIIFYILGSLVSSQLNLLNYYIIESENISEDFVLNKNIQEIKKQE